MPIIHAHRGASAYAPENTLPAFRLALEQKADGIETDIHLTRDGRFVVCHDDEIARTSNGQGKIQDMTVEQLKQYDFGVKFGPAFAGTPIPTLKWTRTKVPAESGEVDGLAIDYYGQSLNLVFTETGFELDYLGSMLMRFAAE